IFFFQAEDGIRDRTVTGVQTCALPILERRSRAAPAASRAGAECAAPSRATLLVQRGYGAPATAKAFLRPELAGLTDALDWADMQIGRASCRERGAGSERAGEGKERKVQ